eukprot:scaffold27127_cov74-Cyclotella_meneghiniana.AAC.1
MARCLLGRIGLVAKLQLKPLTCRPLNSLSRSSIASTRCASSLIYHHHQAIDVRRPASNNATGFNSIQLSKSRTSWMMQQMKISVRFYNQKSWVVRDCKSIDEILETASKRIDESLPVADAAVWSSISRMITRQQFSKHRNTDTIEHQISVLLRFTCDSLTKLKPRQLSEITLSIAKIVQSIREANQRRRVSIYHQAFGKVLQESSSNPNQGIFHALAKATDANLPRFDARSLSNTAYAYALLGYDPKIDERSLLGVIAEKSIDCMHQFNEQDLANMIWSNAKLNVDNPRLFQSVGDAVASKRDLIEFAPQALANIVWAYATTKTQHAGLFQKVGDGIVAMVDLSSFAPQNLANIVWAYATNKTEHPGLFQKVGDSIVAMDDLRSFNPQNLANIVWAYAKNNTRHAGLFQKVGDSIVAMDGLRSFAPQNLANIVWAYATNKTQHHGLFQRVGNSIVAMDDLRSFNAQNLANIVWAYATINTHHPNLFRKVGDAIASSDGSKVFTTQDLANIVWAYAKLDVKNPSLFTKIGKSIGALDDLSSFNTQALSNIAWSFAVADVDVPVTFDDAFTRALIEKQNEFNVKDLRQLYQWHIWQIEKSNRGLPESIRWRCEQLFKNSRSLSSAPNDRSSSIPPESINVLKETHLPAYNEPLVENISYEEHELKPSSASGENIDSQPSIHPPKATDLELMTVPELKDLLRTKGLKVGGRKEELIARLLEEVT